jgi:hypothetical protein
MFDFAEFDVAELKVLDAQDALGLPQMGASIEVDLFVTELDEALGDTEPGAVSVGSCSCCCCC